MFSERWAYEEYPNKSSKKAPITMVIHSVPVSILSTCRLINEEAKPIIEAKLAKILHEPCKVFLDRKLIDVLLNRGILNAVAVWAEYLRSERKPRVEFDEFMRSKPRALLPVTDYYNPNHRTVRAFIMQAARVFISKTGARERRPVFHFLVTGDVDHSLNLCFRCFARMLTLGKPLSKVIVEMTPDGLRHEMGTEEFKRFVSEKHGQYLAVPGTQRGVGARSRWKVPLPEDLFEGEWY